MSVKSSFFYGDPVSTPKTTAPDGRGHTIPCPTRQAGPHGLKRGEIFLEPPLVWKEGLPGESFLKISSIKLLDYWFNHREGKSTVE